MACSSASNWMRLLPVPIAPVVFRVTAPGAWRSRRCVSLALADDAARAGRQADVAAAGAGRCRCASSRTICRRRWSTARRRRGAAGRRGRGVGEGDVAGLGGVAEGDGAVAVVKIWASSALVRPGRVAGVLLPPMLIGSAG